MLKMKLPVKPEEGIVETAEDKLAETFECNLHLPGAACQSLRRHLDSPDLVQKIQDRETDLATRLISKEIVYEWFGLLLSSAQRIEFICGLLDLCNPLELRFLGSCLEDLARKDYHFLRDSEMRANSPSDIGHLKDVTDTEVRSKLLVYLALMRSENRECAGLLYRVLAHMDTLVNNYPLPNTFAYRGSSEHDSKHGSEAECPVDNGVRMEDELLLLLTMATLHPAFTFRQRVGLRDTLEELKKRVADCASRVKDNILFLYVCTARYDTVFSSKRMAYCYVAELHNTTRGGWGD
ncbi:zinc finger CCHC domain-containing protein 2-like [Protopterus annectens]|uniref:zinc finger CCHC domain-containing protein 2-like n=1 Tax=Protopterus annectens TaxID=7888 RepID=UPI001CF9BB85|nr:zinc finger CCHC domain-containing protein 2-like [Protopterus annectens]